MNMNIEKKTSGNEALTGKPLRAAIYCRLSKDDDLQGESASISNQRDMLTGYCKANGWQIVGIYQDDGFTGLNMDRPDLQNMLEAVRKREIDVLVTKDLSRLGRNYLETGHLTEDFFPRHGVRYIAVNDGIDTERENNDIAPFKNVLNEMYSKDISKKVHSSYLLKANQGKFTGCLAPIGYKKDPDDKYHLIPDPETAWIVRRIFDWAVEGHGSNYIRRRLEQEKIACPTWWNRNRGLRNTYTKHEKADPEKGKYIWDFSVIEDLLQNPVYYGAIASQRCVYRFKLGVISEKPQEDWITVENQHEPIIDKRTFDTVQTLIRKRKHPVNEEFSLFSGILKCAECGKSLTIRNTHAKHPQRIYACVTYNKYGKEHCTQHRVEYDRLYDLVLEKIREEAKTALADGKALLKRLKGSYSVEMREEKETIGRRTEKAKDRLLLLDKMVTKLYEDMLSEKISGETFERLLAKTQQEQEALKAEIADDEAKVSDESRIVDETQEWLEVIREYADIKELDSATLHRLVKEILVHEEIDKNRKRHISVEIHFNFKSMTGGKDGGGNASTATRYQLVS